MQEYKQTVGVAAIFPLKDIESDVKKPKHKKTFVEKSSLKELTVGTVTCLTLWELGFIRYLMPRIATWAKKQEFFEFIKHRSGNFAETARDDFTHLTVLGLHHCLSGSMAMLADHINKDFLFRYALMLEVAFEISDSCRMFLGLWPYKNGQVSNLMKFAMFAHHMPGLLMVPTLLKNGDHSDLDMRNLGAWLLFAGGASALGGAYVHTRDFENPFQMKQGLFLPIYCQNVKKHPTNEQKAALVQSIASLIFIYARFYLFPQVAYDFVHKDLDEKYGKDSIRGYLGRFAALGLLTFNILLLKRNFVKSLKYLGKVVFPEIQV